jgi:tRNA(His) 5'-end guanylyltransferase
MSQKDSLGDRMKGQYEDRYRFSLPRRTYTIIRCDGKSFHTYTRGCDKPYDDKLSAAMLTATIALCEAAQGSAFGYVQSDEISVLLTDFATIQTDAWFDGNVQKIASVSASIVTETFNAMHGWHGRAHFDARVFTIPDPVEVENYFIWRQQDATRNSISGLAQAHFSAKQLHGVNNAEMQEMLFREKGINWNDSPVERKRGICAIHEDESWRGDFEIPVFTADRTYLSSRIPRHL